MRDNGVSESPNVITFSAAISACEKGGQWKRALSLLDEMRDNGVAPDVIIFNAAILACAKASRPGVALQLFDQLDASQLQANEVSFNALLDALRAQPAQAREYWNLGRERGFYSDFECLEDGVPHLDLHNFSEGAAEAAVRWWLEEALGERLRGGATQRLEVITGWGKSRMPSHGGGDLRATVEKLFHEMEVPMMATTNPGCVVADLARWGPGQRV
jgi:pentatricopeptide repeat protein